MLFSFVIPTYKNKLSLPRCVAQIRQICAEAGLEYEILVVDNFATNEYINSVAHTGDERVKLFKNPTIGAHHSRRMGLAQSKGETLIFVDDDNYLTLPYVQFIAQKAVLHQNNIATPFYLGCATQEAFSVDWTSFDFHPHSFACGTLVETKFKQDIPVYWGAGAAMNRSLAQQIFDEDLIVEGRMAKKDYIMSGEDHEMSLRAYFLGAHFSYFEGIGLHHDFNAERLNADYYQKIQTGFQYAAWILNGYYLQHRASGWQASFSYYLLHGYARSVLYFVRHPFALGSRLILLDAFRTPSILRKRYETVSKFVNTFKQQQRIKSAQ